MPLQEKKSVRFIAFICGSIMAADTPVWVFNDDSQPSWWALGPADFAPVNSAADTWSWTNGVLHCTGTPVSVPRTAKQYENFEMVVEWSHQKPAGNSGFFVWVTPESVQRLTEAGKPGCRTESMCRFWTTATRI